VPTPTPIENRIQRVREEMAAAGVDTLLVLVAENRRYLSGFTGEDTQFDESAGALLITADARILATDSRYELQARQEAPLYEVACYKEGLDKDIAALLKRLNTQRLGFESVRLSFKQYEQIAQALRTAELPVELMALEDLVEKHRIIKDEDEIDAIRQALVIAESAFSRCRPMIKPGMTEKELAWLMEKAMRDGGADGLSFPVIVASGPNSALPHAVPGDRKIRSGEPILLDWGVRLNGYCSDISRTVVLGPPDNTFENVFRTVLEAQQQAIAAIRSEVSSKAVDQVARDHIDAKGFAGKFGHGLGHGTGLAIHEMPRLSPLKNMVLKNGMVSTVEPGIYLPDWGGVRLENMIVVRDDGAEVLNRLDPADCQVG
jgi:Xaa-Pro aminopeptidase